MALAPSVPAAVVFACYGISPLLAAPVRWGGFSTAPGRFDCIYSFAQSLRFGSQRVAREPPQLIDVALARGREAVPSSPELFRRCHGRHHGDAASVSAMRSSIVLADGVSRVSPGRRGEAPSDDR